MSGSAGGNRIKREHIDSTVKKYKKEVLSKCSIYESHIITGSYNVTDRKDFGDIDLVIHFNSDTKRNAKEVFIETIQKLPDDVIVPFKSTKYMGRKYLNTGEIITVLYPIEGTSEYVQIDNIFALSMLEQIFKHTFLSFPAPVQGLILGLVKAACVENSPDVILRELNIPYYIPKKNEEYEFTLSSSNLSLYRVTYGENYKMIKRREIWLSKEWKKVETLLCEYNLDTTFDELFRQIDFKLEEIRSRNRVKGIFKSMVSVKSGEVGTTKGDEKIRTLNKVNLL